MCLMIDRSKVSLEKAKDALERYSANGQEAWLDSACFDTQQALEFLLKGILLEYGKGFGKSHDILYLLGLVKEAGFSFPKEDDLELLAGTLTSWEEGGRYGSGIRTTIQTVRRFHNIYNDILEQYLDVQEKQQNSDA